MFFKVSFGPDQDCFLYFGPKLKHFNVKLIKIGKFDSTDNLSVT